MLFFAPIVVADAVAEDAVGVDGTSGGVPLAHDPNVDGTSGAVPLAHDPNESKWVWTALAVVVPLVCLLIYLRRRRSRLPEFAPAEECLRDGKIPEEDGHMFYAMLNMARFIVNDRYAMRYKLRSVNAVQKLVQSGRMLDVFVLNGLCYTYWESGPKSQPGIYELLDEWVHNGKIATHYSEEQRRRFRELVRRDARRWGSERLSGEWYLFKMVACKGTVMISMDKKTVVHALGMSDSIVGTLGRHVHADLPVVARVTLLPFAGWYVYDGIVLGNQNAGPNQRGARQRLLRDLEAVYERACAQGTVLPRPRDAGAEERPAAPGDLAAAAPAAVPPEPTASERQLLEELAGLCPGPFIGLSNDYAVMWTVRRACTSMELGSTDRRFAVIGHTGGVLRTGTSRDPVPSPTELLRAVVRVMRDDESEPLPVYINVDHKGLAERLAELCELSELDFSVEFAYYPPPSEEERIAMEMNTFRNAGMMGGGPMPRF